MRLCSPRLPSSRLLLGYCPLDGNIWGFNRRSGVTGMRREHRGVGGQSFGTWSGGKVNNKQNTKHGVTVLWLIELLGPKYGVEASKCLLVAIQEINCCWWMILCQLYGRVYITSHPQRPWLTDLLTAWDFELITNRVCRITVCWGCSYHILIRIPKLLYPKVPIRI